MEVKIDLHSTKKLIIHRSESKIILRISPKRLGVAGSMHTKFSLKTITR